MKERKVETLPKNADFFNATLMLGFFPQESYLLARRVDDLKGGAAFLIDTDIETKLGKPTKNPPSAVNFFDAMIGAETESLTAAGHGDKVQAEIHTNEAHALAVDVVTAPDTQIGDVLERIDLLALTSPKGEPMDPEGLTVTNAIFTKVAAGIAEIDTEEDGHEE